MASWTWFDSKFMAHLNATILSTTIQLILVPMRYVVDLWLLGVHWHLFKRLKVFVTLYYACKPVKKGLRAAPRSDPLNVIGFLSLFVCVEGALKTKKTTILIQSNGLIGSFVALYVLSSLAQIKQATIHPPSLRGCIVRKK